ncbi:MAG: RNA polymerase sigma factor [Dehalococcoidia bacterium]
MLDQESFERLYQETFDTVYRYACVLVDDPSLAEDLAADVYLRAWRNRDSFRRQSKPLSWLLAIAHNTAMSAHRQRARGIAANRELSILAETSAPGPFPDAGPTTGALYSAIRNLPSDQQQVILLRFFDGLSHVEVAEQLQKQPGAVRALQYRALKRLRSTLHSSVAGR